MNRIEALLKDRRRKQESARNILRRSVFPALEVMSKMEQDAFMALFRSQNFPSWAVEVVAEQITLIRSKRLLGE